MIANDFSSVPLEHNFDFDSQEYSNVTKFRDSLLGIIDGFQKNPAKRFIITKRGQPQAVLMSYQTYRFVSKIVNEAMNRTAGLTKEQAVAAERARRAARDLSQDVETAQAGKSLAEVLAAVQNPEDVRLRVLEELQRMHSSTDFLYGLFDQQRSLEKK